ncbi:MAG: DUF4097 family beta strand repeat protein [Firmicutes bacterium]|jgi:hypothetical protein|nr:DUF4097 family beta strand repeat protein [Bacillota bacterium]
MNTTQKVIKTFAICLAALIILSIINGVAHLVTSAFSFNNDVNINETYNSDINNIKIDVGTTNMVIKYGDTFSITAENVSKEFKIKEEGNTLVIKEKNITIFGNKKSSHTTITIPNDLNNLSIDIGAGKLELSDITSNNFSLNQGAGKVVITNLISNNTTIDGGAGELHITSSKLQNLDLELGAGKCYYNGILLGNNKIDQGVGELILDLYREDYTIKASKGLGSITINGESYSKDVTVGEGINDIKIDGGIGSIIINTNK